MNVLSRTSGVTLGVSASPLQDGGNFWRSQLLNLLEFHLWVVVFPSPETGISLLTAGFTAGYLDCAPYFSLMKT